MRGEYRKLKFDLTQAMELPPRARRILLPPTPAEPENGTTSACAENTFTHINDGIKTGNYLRVRGEYSRRFVGRNTNLELPPRARRILA